MQNLLIVAPLELENLALGISSRNMEIAKAVDAKKKMMLSSDFSHRHKKRLARDSAVDFAANFEINLSVVNTGTYTKNISVKRVAFQWRFAIITFLWCFRRAQKGDFIVINSIPPEVFFAVMLAATIRDLKVQVDVRDIWPDALSGSGFKKKIFSTYCRIIYVIAPKRKIHLKTFVAPSFKDWIARHLPSGSLNLFAPLGYDELRWPAPVGNLKAATKIFKDSNQITLVYIGYLNNQFDLIPLSKVVKHNKKLSLLIIGDGEQRSSIEELHCSRIKMVGMVSPKEVPSYVEAFSPSLGVIPLAPDAMALLPNKFFDYLALGLPVLNLGSPDAGSIIDAEKIGISGDNSVESISSCVNNLCVEDLNIWTQNVVRYREMMTMQRVADSIAHALGHF